MNQPVSLRTFARYAAPGILGQVGISCYILADTFFVSRGTGAIGLAALNIALPLYNLMNGIGLMIGVGSATHFTICRAQHQQRDADRTFTHAVGLGLAAGCVFPAARPAGRRPARAPARRGCGHLPLTLVYLRTLLCFGPFFVMNNVLLAFVRNDGGPNRAMAGMIIGSLSNVVMD